MNKNEKQKNDYIGIQSQLDQFNLRMTILSPSEARSRCSPSWEYSRPSFFALEQLFLLKIIEEKKNTGCLFRQISLKYEELIQKVSLCVFRNIFLTKEKQKNKIMPISIIFSTKLCLYIFMSLQFCHDLSCKLEEKLITSISSVIRIRARKREKPIHALSTRSYN